MQDKVVEIRGVLTFTLPYPTWPALVSTHKDFVPLTKKKSVANGACFSSRAELPFQRWELRQERGAGPTKVQTYPQNIKLPDLVQYLLF